MAQRRGLLNTDALKLYCLNKAANLVDVLSNRLGRIGDSRAKFLPQVFVVKFALTLIALLTMVTLFISNINVFEPITTQFSEWASSSIAAFTISIIVVKFVVISFCLTIFAVKRSTLDGLISRVRDLKTARFPVVIWEKVSFRFIR